MPSSGFAPSRRNIASLAVSTATTAKSSVPLPSPTSSSSGFSPLRRVKKQDTKDLRSKTTEELNGILTRNENLLKKETLILSLPDKGERLRLESAEIRHLLLVSDGSSSEDAIEASMPKLRISDDVEGEERNKTKKIIKPKKFRRTSAEDANSCHGNYGAGLTAGMVYATPSEDSCDSGEHESEETMSGDESDREREDRRRRKSDASDDAQLLSRPSHNFTMQRTQMISLEESLALQNSHRQQVEAALLQSALNRLDLSRPPREPSTRDASFGCNDTDQFEASHSDSEDEIESDYDFGFDSEDEEDS